MNLDLPTTEYLVTFADGSVAHSSVHPDQSLAASLGDLLRAAGSEQGDVASVEGLRAFVLDQNLGEGPAGGGRQRGDGGHVDQTGR